MKVINYNNSIRLILILVLCGYNFLANAADVYKWVDEKGQVYYSTEPPKNWTPSVGSQKGITPKIEALDVDDLKNRNVVPPVGKTYTLPTTSTVTDTKTTKLYDHHTLKPYSLNSPNDPDYAALQKSNCEIAYHNIEVIQSGFSVFVYDKQGKKTTINAQQKETALKKAQKYISDSCESVASSTTPILDSSKEKSEQDQSIKHGQQPEIESQSHEKVSIQSVISNTKKDNSDATVNESNTKKIQESISKDAQPYNTDKSPEKPVNEPIPPSSKTISTALTNSTSSISNTSNNNYWPFELRMTAKTIQKSAIVIVCFVLTSIVLFIVPSWLYNPIFTIISHGFMSQDFHDRLSSEARGCAYSVITFLTKITIFCLTFSALFYWLNHLFGNIFSM